MTVNYISEDAGARSGKNSRGVRTYTRAFTLVTTSQSEGPHLVGSHPSLPRIGSPHPEDFGAWCVELSVENSDPWKGWTVTASYDSTVELNENPLFEPASIEWDGETFEETAIYDRDGNAVLNSAGDPFLDVFRERTRRVVSVMKNISQVPTWIITAEDAVNSAAFQLDGFTIPAGLARLGAPRLGKWQKRNGITYREMSMSIRLRKDGWNLEPLDAGFRYRDGSSNLKRITSYDGTDVTQPVCLNGAGAILSNPTPANAVYGDFDVYPEFDFNLLPLT